MNRITRIRLDKETYGVNKGMLTGVLEVENEWGEVRINVDPAKAAEILRILAPALVQTSQDVASMMIGQIEAQAVAQLPNEIELPSLRS